MNALPTYRLLPEAPRDETPAPSTPAPGAVRLSRRLADRILMAFHQACDQQDVAVAEALMACCETVLTRAASPGAERRFDHQELAPGYVRLWKLRAPEGYLTHPEPEMRPAANA